MDAENITIPRRWGILLRNARKQAGWGSGRHLARQLNISCALLTQVESGIRRPSDTVARSGIVKLVGSTPTLQENVLWSLVFAFRPLVRRLAYAIARVSLPHTTTKFHLAWEEIWHCDVDDDDALILRVQQLEDGQLVDFLLVSTTSVAFNWDTRELQAYLRIPLASLGSVAVPLASHQL